MTEKPKPNDIHHILIGIEKEALLFFQDSHEALKDEISKTFVTTPTDPNRFWEKLPEELQHRSRNISLRITNAFSEIARIAKNSSFSGDEDLAELKVSIKSIRSSLRLRRYYYREPEVLHDEGTVLGFRHADQSDDQPAYPSEAWNVFSEKMEKTTNLFDLISSNIDNHGNSFQDNLEKRESYVAGTAFIMMWMDPNQPELNDVVDTVKDVFENFDIKAIRADDIEHESLITHRILNEISSSEFLFADLTGSRPNVYYEVGYAHALKKRVILFRKSGTDLHFDLSGYNCPDYQNLRDLKEKLTRRLESLTNRKPKNK